MNERPTGIDWGLTDREKQTLRLIVRGHDAKSTARRLGLSVHTINERLRAARRKMAVSSSREAARLLLEAEGAASAPEFFGDSGIGADTAVSPADASGAPVDGAGRRSRRPWIIGALVMTLFLGLLALGGSLSVPSMQAPTTPAAGEVPATDVSDAALRFLTLIDEGRWSESYRATGTAFRKLNTEQVWTDVSERVRDPLGKVVSRQLLRQESLPAPPAGYEVVKFRTRFANREAVETVTLDREDGGWRVVGVMID